MAYGDSSTSLNTFDININGKVFKEVTGITLEQFRSLRDTYQFLITLSLMNQFKNFTKREKLANYFDENQEEDIFDYIPHQKTNQIYTPKK